MDNGSVPTDTTAVKIKIVSPDDFMGIGVSLRIEIAFPSNDVGKGGVAARDGMMELGPGRHRDIEVFRLSDDIRHRPRSSMNLPANDLYLDALGESELGNLGALHVPVAGLHQLVGGREISPELKAVYATLVIPLRHLLVDDAAAGRHPLHIPRCNYSAVAQAVAMVHFSSYDICDGFNATMRMPGEALQIVGGVIAAKIIQEEEGVELGHLDYLIFGSIVSLIGWVTFPSLMNRIQGTFLLLTVLVWVFIEAYLLTSWGYTPGKKLLGILVRDKNGERLNYKKALNRSAKVYLRGMGIVFPIIAMVTMIIEYEKLVKNGIT
jgi:hypothetical protein